MFLECSRFAYLLSKKSSIVWPKFHVATCNTFWDINFIFLVDLIITGRMDTPIIVQKDEPTKIIGPEKWTHKD